MEMDDTDYLKLLYCILRTYVQTWAIASFASKSHAYNFNIKLNTSFNILREFLSTTIHRTGAFSSYDKYVDILPLSLEIEEILDAETKGIYDIWVRANDGYTKLNEQYLKYGEKKFQLPYKLYNAILESQELIGQYKSSTEGKGQEEIIFGDILQTLNNQDSYVPTNNKILCKFENNTFFYELKDGSTTAINFETRQNTRFMLTLFKVIYSHWQKNGTESIPKSEIRLRMKKEGINEEVTDKLIKDTIANIRTSKIEPSGLSKHITLSYDRKSEGYCLTIT